jgi:hypothetical protein
MFEISKAMAPEIKFFWGTNSDIIRDWRQADLPYLMFR